MRLSAGFLFVVLTSLLIRHVALEQPSCRSAPDKERCCFTHHTNNNLSVSR